MSAQKSSSAYILTFSYNLWYYLPMPITGNPVLSNFLVLKPQKNEVRFSAALAGNFDISHIHNCAGQYYPPPPPINFQQYISVNSRFGCLIVFPDIFIFLISSIYFILSKELKNGGLPCFLEDKNNRMIIYSVNIMLGNSCTKYCCGN
jgi:hypothetical protein